MGLCCHLVGSQSLIVEIVTRSANDSEKVKPCGTTYHDVYIYKPVFVSLFFCSSLNVNVTSISKQNYISNLPVNI